MDGLAELCCISQYWLRMPVLCSVFKSSSVLQAPRCVPTHQDGTDISSRILVDLTIPARVADATSFGLCPRRALTGVLFPEQGAEGAVVYDVVSWHELWGYGGDCSAKVIRHSSVHS